jgi:hypothetical protein
MAPICHRFATVMLNKMIDMADNRLHNIESSLSKLVAIVKEFTDA